MKIYLSIVKAKKAKAEQETATKRPQTVVTTLLMAAERPLWPSLKKQFLKLLGLHPHQMRIKMMKTKMCLMAATERPMPHLLKERKRPRGVPREGRLRGHLRGHLRGQLHHGLLRGKHLNGKLLNEQQRYIILMDLYDLY